MTSLSARETRTLAETSQPISETALSLNRVSMTWVRFPNLPGITYSSRPRPLATRIVAGWYFLHQEVPSYPKTNFDAFQPDNEETNDHIDVQDDHYKIVREIGAASAVLLKNERGALPLNKPRSLVLVGSDAGPGRVGPNEFADQVSELGRGGNTLSSWSSQGGNTGILAMGWGSGTANFTYLVSVIESFAFLKHLILTGVLITRIASRSNPAPCT